jgi:uncharacterized radical SAM protein YgiQ
MAERGWDALDVLVVTGDAYVDHPAFGPVLIARWLESNGFRVGIVAQPRWSTIEDVARMGRPRLFAGVSAGNLDSMLGKLTAQKKVRGEDPYSPGGRRGMRPNRATIVYANLCRQAFPGLPVVLGGIEASLRRIAHYDYWSDSVRRSILLDAKADLLAFGMAERAVLEVARRLRDGESVRDLGGIRGTAVPLRNRGEWEPIARRGSREVADGRPVVLPSYESAAASARAFAQMTRAFELETNPHNARPLLQPHGDEAVFLAPPSLPLSTRELDALYALPFARRAHPSYAEPVPALATVEHSLVSTRGCFGGCSFCSIGAHEGRIVQSRSRESLVAEARRLAGSDAFRGTVSDVGGPTANMFALGCRSDRAQRVCRRPSCLHPRICRHLETDQRPLLELLRELRAVTGVRHVFVASGIRHDLALRCPELVAELAARHTGGQLSVAPEHADPHSLARMRKPPIEAFERFAHAFERASAAAGRIQVLAPYFVVGHPGSTLRATVDLAVWLRDAGLRPSQVQEFIPTPMTVATAMYHSGLDPTTLEPVHVAREPRERRLMKALVLSWDEAWWPLAREALRRAGREDLVGSGPGHWVPAADRAWTNRGRPRADSCKAGNPRGRARRS